MNAAGGVAKKDEAKVILSCMVSNQVMVKVETFSGQIPVGRFTGSDGCTCASAAASLPDLADRGGISAEPEQQELFVVCQLYHNGTMMGLEARTSHVSPVDGIWTWNQWLTFPYTYKDLASKSLIALTIWCASSSNPSHDVPVGGTVQHLFSRKSRLKTGRQRLRVWMGRAADGTWNSSTLGKVPLAERGEVFRLDKLLKRYEKGLMPRVPWLDRLALAHIHRARARDKDTGGLAASTVFAAVDSRTYLHGHNQHRKAEGPNPPCAVCGMLGCTADCSVRRSCPLHSAVKSTATASASVSTSAAGAAGGKEEGAHTGKPPGATERRPGGRGMLFLELYQFDRPVVFQELADLGPNTGAASRPGARGIANGRGELVRLADADILHDNPSEGKQLKLARNVHRGLIDSKVKPNFKEKRQIEAVLAMPPSKPLTGDEKFLLWKFRFSLTTQRHALTKFLRAVDWGDAQESKQAIDLMQQRWEPIDTADALELLSPSFTSDAVRTYAVGVLARADDEELLCYLLQLVHALRYESADDSRLAAFLLSRAVANYEVANFLHWYLSVEFEDKRMKERFVTTHQKLEEQLKQSPTGAEAWVRIKLQVDLVSQLRVMARNLQAQRGGRAYKIERMQAMLSSQGILGDLSAFPQGVPLPLRPQVMITGIIPSQSSIFRSSLQPLLLTFKTEEAAPPLNDQLPSVASSPSEPSQDGSLAGDRAASSTSGHDMAAAASTRMGPHANALPSPGPSPSRSSRPLSQGGVEEDSAHDGGSMHTDRNEDSVGGVFGAVRAARTCKIIYKKGDDLRQDQLVIQILSLMDRLLKKENLDLKLTPYRVLATGSDDGMVEFVPSTPLAQVLQDYRSILKFFAQHHPDPTGPYGVRREVLNTYIKSCAGYCVIMYILGVGDRHLDNVMLTRDGRLFHIDFGYILGNDPKPFPPPMKLCKEMVEAMGGADSSFYTSFKSYCCEAFNILRKSANLILNLFHLMAGADIPNIAADPEKAILKLQEKFRLDLDDEQAVQFFQTLINDSVSALFPQMVETIHRWAQYWR
eukprot:jgi/Mesvir1/28015/Mv20202-RA.1